MARKKKTIKLSVAELQANSTRQDWAEGLILQLPQNHEGRNSWLLNYGRGKESSALRSKHNLFWKPSMECSESRNEQLERQNKNGK